MLKNDNKDVLGPIDYKATLLKRVEDLNIRIIDIENHINENIDNPLSLWPFRMNGHMNEDGYRFVSTSIHKELTENYK